MKTMRNALSLLGAPLLLAVAASGTQSSAVEAERVAILERAERYAAVEWAAEERHLLHGEDPDGVRVDTPDVSIDPSGWKVGAGNVGMPYCWGGFTSLKGLESALARDLYAGHVPARGNARASGYTLGVDCSGLVSRCWRLPVKQSTRSLGALCYELDDYDELLPGDVVNRFDSHVALFTGWVDDERTAMNVIEAARIRVEPAVYQREELLSLNFRPMRYKLLDDRWQPMPAADAPGEAMVPAGTRGEFVMLAGGEDARDPMSRGLRTDGPHPGDWARFDATEGALRGAGVTSTWMAVAGEPGTLELQRRLDAGNDTLASGITLGLDGAWPELLVSVAGFSNPLQDLEIVTSSVDEGTWSFGDQRFPARRVSALIECRMLSRSTLYPTVLELECVISDAVPLLGICELDLQLEVEYGTRDGDRVLGTSERRYVLQAFGRS